MKVNQPCYRCKGWTYPDFDGWWCLMCGAWQLPPGFQPLPYSPRLEESSPELKWRIDPNGDIVDDIDDKIEDILKSGDVVTVTGVARKIHCSNSAARMSLDRLVRINQAKLITYGPMNRWQGYQQI